MTTVTTSPWAGLYAPAGKPDLRDTSTTQSAAGKKARTAFDITASTSAVTLAVKPRQAAYRAGPGISVTNSAQGRRDAEMRRVMRLTKI